MSTFTDLIQLIANGDPVDEATINRVFRTQNANIQYLRELLEQAFTSSAIYRREATVASNVSVGMPVYYNASTQRFEKGLAQAFVSAGVLQTSAAAQLWGVVSHKHNSTKADIVLQGYVADLDLDAAVDGAIDSGLYFLSGATAGGLTKQEPSVSIPVLFVDEDGGVYVKPSFADIYTEHKHYRFELRCVPAGDQELDGGIWTIENPDDETEGWLPADDAVFDGNAPVDAKFGYNLSAADFGSSWPPLPLDGVTVDWVDDNGAAVWPLQTGHMVVDEFGIWWLQDCEDNVPWPANFGQTTTTPAPDTCPPPGMSMVLWYSKPKFQTSKTVVTSLRPAENSIITIRCLSTENEEDETTGDLEIDVDLELLLADATDTEGFTVLKGINDDGEFTRGPVIEALKAGASNVTLSSAGGEDDDGYHHGKVTINVLQNVVGGELDVQSVQLHGAEASFYADTLTIKFPQNREAEYRGEVYVPLDIGADEVSLGLRFWVLGRIAGELPAMTLTYRIYPRPTPTAVTPTALPTSDTAGTIDTTITLTDEDQYVEVTSSGITVPVGSVLQFTINRDDSGAGDGYEADVHVLRQSGVILELDPA